MLSYIIIIPLHKQFPYKSTYRNSLAYLWIGVLRRYLEVISLQFVGHGKMDITSKTEQSQNRVFGAELELAELDYTSLVFVSLYYFSAIQQGEEHSKQ